MTFPAATFTAVAPPPDGLALAFTSARRRRNSKAAVSAFGGAVVIASLLSLAAPPGQSLVQEQPQPAHGGLLTGLPDAPRHGAPAPAVRTTTTSLLDALATSTHPVQSTGAAPVRSFAGLRPHTCATSRMLACVVVQTPAPGGPTMRANVCPAAAAVTVEYDAPQAATTRSSSSRTVAVGNCPS